MPTCSSPRPASGGWSRRCAERGWQAHRRPGERVGVRARGELVAPGLGLRRPARPMARARRSTGRGDVRRSSARTASIQQIAHSLVRCRAGPPRSWSCSCTPPGRPATRRRRVRLDTTRPRSEGRGARPGRPARGAGGAGRRARRPRATTGTTRTTCGASTARAAADSTSGGRATRQPPPGARRARARGRARVNRDHLGSGWAGHRPGGGRAAQLGRVRTVGRELSRAARAGTR